MRKRSAREVRAVQRRAADLLKDNAAPEPGSTIQFARGPSWFPRRPSLPIVSGPDTACANVIVGLD